jgi:ketosteroid isomerase-like protein
VSEENVDLTHRIIDAFNRRDLDALLALLDDDVEAAPPPAAIEGNYHGHAGIRRWWESLFEALPDFTIEVVEVRGIGDLTLAVLRNLAHGAASGTLTQERLWLVSEWRDGKVIWARTFASEAEALEAVELVD